MRCFWIYILLIMSAGCGLKPQMSKAPSPNGSNSLTRCSARPSAPLLAENVERLNLLDYQNPLSMSETASPERHIGYTFKGSSGYTLEYDSPQNLCVWIFAPDNSLLSGDALSNLPQTGIYTIQVSVPSSSTKFDLELSLQHPSLASSISDKRSQTSKLPPSDIANGSSKPPSPNSDPEIAITQDEALEILEDYLEVKKTVMAPPYDLNRFGRLITGKRHEEVLGSVKWLRENNAYYRYPNDGRVEPTGTFSVSSRRAIGEFNITETTILYSNGKLERRTGPNTYRYEVQFRLEDEIWKIESIEKQ